MAGESEAAVKSSEANQLLKTLGKYVIERKLGQGGMGTVYLAQHSDLKKSIALKVLPQDKAKNPTLVKRFKSEAQAAAKLEHPNIVAVYDTGEADGYLYIAMEFVDGIDLFEHVKRRGVVPVKRSIEIIKQVASALQHAFEQNIVHRDIKPSNLLVRRDGVIKLTDLGLARSVDDTLETNITRAGTTVGTVDYMAPEQARNSKLADIRSDIYSLGCTWYQMLTGQPPFPEGSLTNKLQAHATKPLPDPRDINENVPEGVFAVLQRMTAKKPDDRYQSPAELLEDLAQSKLTKAAFANEIFSDLSDHDLPAYEGGDEDEDEDYDDEEFEENETPHRKSPRASDESSTASGRRKSPLREQADEPSAPRKKSRARDAETSPVDETQSLKSGRKAPSKHPVEEDEPEAPTTNRSGKRHTADHDDENDSDNGSVINKKRRGVTPEDDDKSHVSKRNKPTTEPGDKKSSKAAPKAMPPKRQAVVQPEAEQGKQSSEGLKNLLTIGGLLAVICGAGLLIFRWGSHAEFVHPPSASTIPAAVVDPARVRGQRVREPQDAPRAANSPADGQKSQQTANATVEKPVPEFDLTKQPMPAWSASAAPELRDLPVLTVGSGAASPTHFGNLDDALRAVEQNGAIIRLIGNGPFPASGVALKPGIKLMIAPGSNQDQPLIFLKPNESGLMTGLTIENGVLDLRGLHFIFDRSQDFAAGSNKIINVVDGQLFVRGCSFSAPGNEALAATAISCNFKQDAPPNVALEPQLLLDRVIVRGSGLAGVSIDRPNIDAIVQDSLFATGAAPAILLNAHQLTPGSSDNPSGKPSRMLRLIRTTLCVRKVALEIAAESNAKPPLTALLLQDSVCSAEGSGNAAVLISATKWPSVTSNTGGWLSNLSLTSLSSLYMGFERLMDLDKSAFKVTNLENWQRVWGKKFEPRQFQSLMWHENSISDLSNASPQEFETSSLPYQELKTGSGSLPGCVVSRLIVPGLISQERLIALSQRPKPPNVIQKPMEGIPWRKVDLTKEDLGQVINRNDWPSGTVIEATGSGIKQITPARFSGKSLRIVFRQGDGAPLKLQPKPIDIKGAHDHAGLFTIENGLLDLQSATIEISSSAKPPIFPWMFSAKNASLILRGCQLSGPTQPDPDLNQGLIQWSTSSAAQPFEGLDSPILSINDCLLMGNGNAIRSELALGNMFLRNSVIATRGYGLNIQPDFTNFRAAANLDMEHMTFSTSKAVVRFEAAQGIETAPQPVRFFVNYCTICPPVEFKANEGAETAIVELAGPVREQKQMQWWGSSNGVAKEVKTLLKPAEGEPVTAASDWISAWGEASEFRFLTGPKAISLTASLPNKWMNFKATSYLLSPNCPASSWAEGGQPLGADIHIVENAIPGKKTSLEPKPASATAPNQSQTAPTMTNKKGVGF